MTLVRYNPLNNFVPSTFGDLIENVLNTNPELKGSFNPSVDIIKNEKSFELHLLAPGMKKDEFNIDLDNDQLTITGERKQDEALTGTYAQQESRFGSFHRSFRITDTVDQENIKAKYEDGILKITLPLLKKVETKKAITIK